MSFLGAVVMLLLLNSGGCVATEKEKDKGNSEPERVEWVRVEPIPKPVKSPGPVKAAASCNPCTIASYFSPIDNVEGAILDTLRTTQASVHCSLFGLSNEALSESLIQLAHNGRDVRVALDRRQAGSQADQHKALENGRVKVRIKKAFTLEHNNYCVIDGQSVITGTWGWNRSAQQQDNSNIIMRKCPNQAQRFEDDFARIWRRDGGGNHVGDGALQ